jgi:hypothetical protein
MNRFFPSTALLIVVEFVIPEGRHLIWQMGRSADIDICRRTRTNGDEIRDLLSAAGFELREVVATVSP